MHGSRSQGNIYCYMVSVLVVFNVSRLLRYPDAVLTPGPQAPAVLARRTANSKAFAAACRRWCTGFALRRRAAPALRY